MSEVTLVNLNTLSDARRPRRYQPYIDAALTMDDDQAVLVNIAGVKSLNGNVNQAISARGLRDRLAVRMSLGKIYIIKRKAK